MMRLKHSGQTFLTRLPSRSRDSGRMVEASTRRWHSLHRLVLGRLVFIAFAYCVTCSPAESALPRAPYGRPEAFDFDTLTAFSNPQ